MFRGGSFRLLGQVFLTATLLFFITTPTDSISAEEKKKGKKEQERPIIGLVLEGGGAKGIAHVGVLKVLHEARIPVDLVAGTSMGSIVGAAYASGRTVDEMTDILTNTNWDALFYEAPPRENLSYRQKSGREKEIYGDAKLGVKDGSLVVPNAFVQGQRVEPLFQRLFGKVPPITSFDKLPIPYRAVAADIETGEMVVLSSGNLAKAARASMAVPGFFSPVEIDGRLLVDGGITDNFPVDVALEMGAEVIIAVQFDYKFRERKDLTDPLAVSAQILDLLLESTTTQRLKMLRDKDILVRPQLGTFGATSFGNAKEILALGEEAARKMLPQL